MSVHPEDVVPAITGVPDNRSDHAARFSDEKKHGHELAHVSSPEGVFDESHPHYGDEFPTEEERHTLHRIPDKIPWAAYLIAYVELAERFSYYGW